MSNSRYSRTRGFIFTLEAVIAFLLLVGFLEFASVETMSQPDYIQKVELKNFMNDMTAVMDENGFLLETIDNSAMGSSQKMDAIYGKITEMLPAGFSARIELLDYNGNVAGCQGTLKFEDCFNYLGMYPAKGESLPSDKAVSHNRTLVIRKQPAPQCEIGLVFAEDETKQTEKDAGKTTARLRGQTLSLAAYSALYFQGDGFDANFFVKTTPSGTVSCDEDIRVDLNISPPDYGRSPADIMLVIDRSGSMDDVVESVHLGELGSGIFNEGTYDWVSSPWGGSRCENFGNWQDLNTFDINSEFEGKKIRVRMDYSGYAGECDPRQTLALPSGASCCIESGSSPLDSEEDSAYLGTYTVQGWSDESISYNLNYYWEKTKMDSAKESAKEFVDYAEWQQPLDQLGLVSFASSASLNQQLLTANEPNKETIKAEIEDLDPTGSTAMGDGIHIANQELIGVGGNPDAMKFQVLLTDGKHNAGSWTPQQAADEAADNDIIIYTIGYGADADAQTLQNIANTTGGTYYHADDEDALAEVYNLIAIDIGTELTEQEPEVGYDANVMIPLERCSDVVDWGSGSCESEEEQDYIYFYVGFIDEATPWSSYFIINFPCDAADSCESGEKVFPMPGTYFYYSDESGQVQTPLLWNENVSGNEDSTATVEFKYRDLAIQITRAVIMGQNQIYTDVNAANTGTLSSDQNPLKYYADDPVDGLLLDEDTVQALTAGDFQMFYDKEINEEGWIYIVVNADNSIRECPGNNIASLYCTGISETQYFALDVWAWRN